MALSVVGDDNATARTAVAVLTTSNELNIITNTDLADKDHVINDPEVSGKKLGSIVIENTAGVLRLMVAQGATDVSPWKSLGTTQVEVTPA
jgi:hypothetical protein